MELSIKDRLYMPALLPKEGNFQEFNIKKSILRKIEISQEERKEIGLQENQATKRIEWDIEKEIPLVLEFTSEEMKYLKQSFEKISDEPLPDDMWSVVTKIYDNIHEAEKE